jgi:drug/metabolite transporter (DMT)-like permease
VPALEASLILLIEPVLNPVWAWLVHGERPGTWSLLGGALILTAATLKTLLHTRPAAAD